MIMLHDLIADQLNHGKDPADIVAVLGFEIGELLSFSSREEDLCFDALLHFFIGNIHKGRFYDQQENDNARTTNNEAPQRTKNSNGDSKKKRPQRRSKASTKDA